MKNFSLPVVAISAACLISLLSYQSSAQPGWKSRDCEYVDPSGAVHKMFAQPKTVYDLKAEFDAYWQGKTPAKGTGYNVFNRWYSWWEPRLYPLGLSPDLDAIEQQVIQFKSKQVQNQKILAASWTAIGPYGIPPSGTIGYEKGRGAGRVNCIEFHPTDPNIIWLGFPAGGLWKSTDGGATWTLNASFTGSNGISDIAISPSNPSVMYLASGDADEGAHAPSKGVFKSTDGGNTWLTTGLSFNLADKARIFKLIVHPTNTDIVVAATASSWGLARTTDGGTTWTKSTWTYSGNPNYTGCWWSDIEFKPNDPNVVYAAMWDGCMGPAAIYISSNGGASFPSYITMTADVGRIALEVTPASNDLVYALCANTNDRGFYGLYKSTNSGSNWSWASWSPNILGYATDGSTSGGQGEYDLSIVVSPTDANAVYVGAVNQWKSSDGGQTWSCMSYWTNHATIPNVHADVHALEINPLNGNLYSGNDGGLWRSADNGITWTEINAGINTHLVERLSDYEADPGLLVFGAQDNSSYKMSGGSWTSIGKTGDGHDNMIDFTNPSIIFTTTQNGTLNKSTDGALTYQFGVGPGQNGAWITPFVMSYQDHNTLFAGYERLYKSTNSAASWTAISYDFSGGTSKRIEHIAVDQTGTTIYVSVGGTLLYKTTNSGANWTDITSGLPVANTKISRVFTNPTSPNNVWVTFNGYAAGQKVYYSSNGGSSWSNISGTLPNIPVLCGVYDQNSTNQTVYIGTDIGVFSRDNQTNDWALFGTGLPDIPVMDLEITYSASKLRAGTRGRSVWEIPISTSPTPPSPLPCNQVRNYPSVPYATNPIYSGNNGNIFGHNTNNITDDAEFYTPNGTYTHVMGVSLNFFTAATSNPLTSKITVKMWKNDGTNSMPGTVLASKDVLISQIITDVTNVMPTEVYFNTPVAATGPYYLGFEVFYVSGDAVGLKSTWYGEVATNTAFTKFNNVWGSYEQWWGAGYKLSMSAFAITGNIPTPNFTATPTTGGPGTVVSFSNTSTSANGFSWTFPGGTPSSSYGTNPTITYSSPGTYNVKLVAYGSCNGKDSIEKVSYIAIGAPQLSTTVTNVTCNSGSNGAIDLTVSGTGNTYLWSNGATTEDLTGIPAGTYTVTVTSGAYTPTTTATVTQPTAISLGITKTDVNCNGNNTGAADLSPSGGTPPYVYSWSNGSTTQDITALTASTYTVTVTDSKGCSQNKSVTISQPPVLVATVLGTTNASCGSNNGSIDLDASGGVTPYTYSWSNGVTVQDPANLASGSYTVTVSDNKGCTKTTSATITQPGALNVAVTSVTNVSCNGGNNGAINITVSGGTAPYTYSWSSGASVEDPSGLAAGTYTVTVTDATACSYNTSATVTQPAAMSATITSQVNVSCNGGANGSIDLSVSGGTAPYTYAWTGGATVQDPSGLSAGPYTVTVTATAGCTTTASANITQPPPLSATIKTITTISCNGGNDGAVDINVSGGTTPYNYAWSNGASIQDISNLAAGTYNVNVTDAKGCLSSVSANVTQPVAVSATIAVTQNVSCFGGNNGAFNLTVTGGTSPYNYNWSNGTTVEDPSGLVAGPHAVTVTDSKGCTATATGTLAQPAELALTQVSQSNVTCNGGSNGSININVTGGTTPYTYSWSNSATTEDLVGLAANIYTVTVTATGGCTVSQPYTITQPGAITVSTVAVTPASCNGGNNGAIDVSVSGGTPPYTYGWAGGATTEDLSGLNAGTYNLTVTASGGCIGTYSATVIQPSKLVSSIAGQVNVTCGSPSGSIDLAVSGGTPSYTYAWSNGATVQDPTGLNAGTYTATVTDSKGCASNSTGTITQPSTLSATSTKVNVSCNGSNNGSINLTPSGGTPPLTFSWSNSEITEDIDTLTAGTYTVTITDNAGCLFSLASVVGQPEVLVATASAITDASCSGSSNGAVDLSVTGGVTPYAYAWSSGATIQDPAGLVAGTYTVTVTASPGCTATATATVNQPSAVTVALSQTNVSCNGGSNGSVTANPSGGTAPYTYVWSNQSTANSISNLAAGLYNVTVSDSKGCNKVTGATVNQPPALSVVINNINASSCNLNNGGLIDIAVSGGTSPYQYSWSNGTMQEDAQNLSAGTYMVTVTDSLACSAAQSASVTQTPQPVVTVNNQKNVTCNGGSNGTMDISVSGGIPPYNYAWSNGATTQDIINLPAGQYDLNLTSGGGCTKVVSYAITEPTVLVLAAAGTNVTCNGLSNGSVNLTVSGGTSPYTYLWSNAATSASLSGLSAGTYTVNVTMVGGCTATASSTLTEPAALSASTTQVNTNCGASTGSIDLTAAGGVSPYSYNWSTGATTEDVSSLSAGSYTVTITDNNQCRITSTTTIIQPGTLSASLSVTNVSCNGSNNGSVNLTASGGTPPYTYAWSSGTTIEDLANLAPGSYTVTVTDGAACSFTSSALITQPAQLSTSILVSSTIGCYGGNTGALNLTITGGTPPMSFAWSNSATTEDISGLTAGTYNVTVTDANGCTSQNSKALSESLQMNAVIISKVDVSCYGGNNGLINLGVTGGTTPYTFNWTNGASTEDLNGLAASSYAVTVTSSGGCTATASATLTQPIAISVSIKTKTDVSCYGGNNGALDINVGGGAGSYGFNWSNGNTSEDVINLPAGNYTVTVTDASSCTMPFTTAITQPAAIVISAVATTITCNGGNNGSINITTSGGTAPYAYAWSNAAVTEDINGLAAGTYTVTVTDVNSCTGTLSSSLANPAPVTVIIDNVINSHCEGGTSDGGNNGAINISVAGGTTPYTFNWSNAAITEDIGNLGAGNYGITVTANNGCTGTNSITVTEPVSISASLNSKTNPTSCTSNDGSIDVTVIGGTPPYTYNWSNGSTVEDLAGIGSGSYNLTVTSSDNCRTTYTEFIDDPGTLAVSLFSTTGASCNGGDNGTANISVSGGTAPYTYAWSTSATTEDIGNLSRGNYTVTVTDAGSCVYTYSVDITEPPPISTSIVVSTSVSCYGSSDGALNLSVTGGTPGFNFNWSTGALTEDISGLTAGLYSVTITDLNGCEAFASHTLGQPGVFTASVISVNNVPCNGGNNGSISVTVNGGASPFTYVWSNSATSEDISGLSAGTYTLTIADANNCTASTSAPVSQSTVIVLSIAVTNVSSNGGNDGGVNLTLSGGAPQYSFAWSNIASTEDISGLAAGSYTVTVTDSLSCTAVTSATVTQPASAGYCSGTTSLTATSATFSDGSGMNVYATNANCKWLIEPANTAYITLYFDTFYTESNNDRVIIYDGADTMAPVLASYSGAGNPYPVMSSGDKMLVQFITNNSINDSGWVATYYAEPLPSTYCSGTVSMTAASGSFSDGSGASQYNGYSNCKWLIQPAGATSITLKFTAFDTENGYDFVTVYDGGDTSAPVLAYFTGTAIDSVISSGGSMLVHFTSDYSLNADGWDALYTSDTTSNSFCTGLVTLTASSGSFGDGSGAANYGPNSDCQWLIQPSGATSITLTFQNFATESGYDYIFVYDGADTSASLLGSYSGNTLLPAVTSTGGSMLVWFLSDYMVQDAGFFATYNSSNVSTVPFCSGTDTLTAASGTFNDGSGAALYVENSACSWLIQPPGATVINLSFTSFNTENGYDFVNVYEGTDASGPLMASYSGNSIPPPVTTLGGSMFVQFLSDYIINDSGWVVNYTSSTTATPSYCSGSLTLTAPSATFHDGSGPNLYGNLSDCYWLIQPPGAQYIALDFLSFVTEAGYDSVRVFDGATTSDPLIMLWWGDTIPPQLVSSGGALLVHFASDSSITDSGFVASYNAYIPPPIYCSGTTTLTASSGSFSDGSGTNNYLENTNCKWLIQPPGATNLTVYFDMLDVEEGYDYVYIYDGTDSLAPLLAYYTGSSLPPPVSTTGGALFVQFISDYIVNASGWDARYDTNYVTPVSYCSGTTTLTAQSGSFDDGSATYNYLNYTDCKWLIQPAGATSITLTFTAFDTETGYDSVVVFDGVDGTAPVLGSYSGIALPPVLLSSGGSLFVQFTSDYMVTAGGFSADYTSTVTTTAFCSGTTALTAASGSLSDGSGASDYVENSDCKWLIQPTGATSITLSFTAFATESGYDYVTVYDGATTSDPLLGVFDGSTLPSPVTSSGGDMLVHFTSDGSVSDAGWDATYTSTTVGCTMTASITGTDATCNGCNDGAVDLTVSDGTPPYTYNWLSGEITEDLSNIGAGTYDVTVTDAVSCTATASVTITEPLQYCSGTTILTASSGTFSDGSGLNNYADNSDCKWLIQPPGAISITLSFTAFETESGYDSVTVYNGGTTSDPVLGSFSGTSIPTPVTSTGGVMLVYFKSDVSFGITGWDASYASTVACTMTASITGSDATCNGCTDGAADLTVSGGAAPFTYAWSNSAVTEDLTNIGAGTYTVTVTDNASCTATASVTITEPLQYCSGTITLTLATDTFDDGSGPLQDYAINSDCYWLIQPPGASNVVLNFILFDTEWGYDSVTIYDGATTLDPVLGSYSGNTLPPQHISTGGSMLVAFWSDFTIPAPGWEAYYTIIVQQGMNNAKVEISTEPNPNNGLFRLKIASQQNSAVEIELYNIMGQKIWTDNFMSGAGINEREIDMTAMPEGIYTLSVNINGNRLYRKVVRE